MKQTQGDTDPWKTVCYADYTRKHPGQSGGQRTTMSAHIIVSTVKVWVSLWSPCEKVVPKESSVLGGSFKRWGLVRCRYRSLCTWSPDKINNSQQRAREKEHR